MKRAIPLAIRLAAGPTDRPALAATNSYNLSGFDKVSASSYVTVVLKQGPFSVQVSEPSGRFNYLELGVRDGPLFAARRPNLNWGWYWEAPQYTVTVTASAYTQINVASHADLSGVVSA